MAKKFGEIVSDLVGVDGQLLRIKNDGTGFEFTDPATIPSYTITNSVTDRAMDANNTTLDELADVVSTLIADLDAAGLTGGGGLAAFQWSTSEQVWPFEKARDGSTLYCKECDLGALPNNGVKTVAHGISDLKDVHKLYGVAEYKTPGAVRPLPLVRTSTVINDSIALFAEGGNVGVVTFIDRSMYNGIIFIFYTKDE